MIHYLYNGISKENRDKLEEIVAGYKNAELIFHDMGGMFKSIKMKRHVTHATYYRMMIPELVPAEVRKAIYLDIDIVVMDDDGVIIIPLKDASAVLAAAQKLQETDEAKVVAAGNGTAKREWVAKAIETKKIEIIDAYY